MANYKEQLLRTWNEWEDITGEDANNPDDFIDWAVAHGKLRPRPEDLHKIYRRQLSSVLRQAMKIDEEGTTYRAKQCVTIVEQGAQRTLWFDVDKGGTPQLRQKAAKQRRDSIADDVFRAKSDVDHMNFAYPNDDQIQFELDFTEDFEERKALELLEYHQKKSG